MPVVISSTRFIGTPRVSSASASASGAGGAHEAVDHGRSGMGWADRVDAYPLAGIFDRRRARQPDDAMLGGGVDRQLRRAGEAGDRGDVDDGAALAAFAELALHLRDLMLMA